MSASEKKLYLTFDDGPLPTVTPHVLSILKQYNAKATFFCVGDNVSKHPQEYAQLLNEGHAVGNHTQHHLNGFKTSLNQYKEDVQQAATHISSNLFRPPYGRFMPAQYNALRADYNIVMWDVLSYDFDTRVTKHQCLHNVIKHSRNGSVIVFHDSVKASDKMLYALPQVLDHFSKLGYAFGKLPQLIKP